MKRLQIILLIFVVFIAFPNSIEAQENAVKPAIYIPADWNKEEVKTKIPEYKEEILKALKVLQKWYAQRLNGKTFRINEEVDVVFSNEIGENKPNLVEDAFYSTGGDKILPFNSSYVRVVFVVGRNGIATGGPGFAFLSYSDLLLLAENQIKDSMLGLIGHELGHSFGLVFAGWAMAHPCTVSTENECKKGAPPDLPSSEESREAIMGIGWPSFPNVKFNNSTFNPEVWKIYQSPFINSQNDPAPPPLTSVKLIPKVKIERVNPPAVGRGEVLEIYGTNFGSTRGVLGSVIFMNVSYGSGFIQNDNEILEWTDGLIRVIVPENALTGELGVKTSDSKNAVFRDLQIRRPTPPPLKITYTTTCGGHQKPLKKIWVELVFKGLEISSTRADNHSSDVANLLYEPGIYIVRAEPINGVSPETPLYSFDIQDISKPLQYSVDFNYPTCPVEETSLRVNFSATCGEDKKPLAGAKMELSKEGEQDSLMVATTDKEGKGFMNLNLKDRTAGNYTLKASPIDGVDPFPPLDTVYHVDPKRGSIWTPSFHYSQCPNKIQCPEEKIYCDTNINEKIYQHGGVWNAEAQKCDYVFDSLGSCSCPEAYSQCGGTAGLENERSSDTFRVIPVCNNQEKIIDYKKENLGATEKCQASSPYPIVSPGPSSSSAEVGLPVLSFLPEVVWETATQIGGIFGQPVSEEKPIKKEVVSINVDGSPVVLDGSSGVDISLQGTIGTAGVFEIPVVIEYSDGSIKAFKLRFNYSPQQEQAQEPEVVDWCSKKECDTAIGKLVCYKKYSDGREEISEPTDERCSSTVAPTGGEVPAEKTIPTQGPTCENKFQYNECIGCNMSRPVYRNTCTQGWSTGPNQNGTECSSYCKAATPGSCDDLHYFDPGVNSCIHKHSPNDPYPDCRYVFDYVDKSYCGL